MLFCNISHRRSWYGFSIPSPFIFSFLLTYLFSVKFQGPGGSMSQVVGLPKNSHKPITNTAQIRAQFCKLQKGCTRLAAESDKFYQLFAHGRWFSPGIPTSSTTKTGRHDITEILLKVALNTKKIKSIKCLYYFISFSLI